MARGLRIPARRASLTIPNVLTHVRMVTIASVAIGITLVVSESAERPQFSVSMHAHSRCMKLRDQVLLYQYQRKSFSFKDI